MLDYFEIMPYEILEKIFDKTGQKLAKYKLQYMKGYKWTKKDQDIEKNIQIIKHLYLKHVRYVMNPVFPILAIIELDNIYNDGIYIYDTAKSRCSHDVKNIQTSGDNREGMDSCGCGRGCDVHIYLDTIDCECHGNCYCVCRSKVRDITWSGCGRYLYIQYVCKPIIHIIDIFECEHYYGCDKYGQPITNLKLHTKTLTLTSHVFARYYLAKKLGKRFNNIKLRATQDMYINNFIHYGFTHHNNTIDNGYGSGHSYGYSGGGFGMSVTQTPYIYSTYFKLPNLPVMPLALHPSQQICATGYDGEYVAFWNIQPHLSLSINSTNTSANSSTSAGVATNTTDIRDEKLPYFKINISEMVYSNTKNRESNKNRSWLARLSWSPCGTFLAIIRNDGSWCIWNHIANKLCYISSAEDKTHIYDMPTKSNKGGGKLKKKSVVNLEVKWEPTCSAYLAIYAIGATPVIWNAITGYVRRIDFGLKYDMYTNYDKYCDMCEQKNADIFTWFGDGRHILITNIIYKHTTPYDDVIQRRAIVYDCDDDKLLCIMGKHGRIAINIWDYKILDAYSIGRHCIKLVMIKRGWYYNNYMDDSDGIADLKTYTIELQNNSQMDTVADNITSMVKIINSTKIKLDKIDPHIINGSIIGCHISRYGKIIVSIR